MNAIQRLVLLTIIGLLATACSRATGAVMTNVTTQDTTPPTPLASSIPVATRTSVATATYEPAALPTTTPLTPTSVVAVTKPTTQRTWPVIMSSLRPSIVLIQVTLPGTSDDPTPRNASGTGIVLSRDGRILTNMHVVQGAAIVTVALSDDTQPRPARVIGGCTCDDLAVLQVEENDGLVPAPLDLHHILQAGDPVGVIGFPFGTFLSRRPTLTTGIVSQPDLAIPDASYPHLIQVDAAINPGNSGGPLVTQDGVVIGITSLGIEPSAAANVGFAIDLASAQPRIAELMKGRRVQWTGMNVEVVGGFFSPPHLIVTIVETGSPAARIGILPGDELISIEGLPVTKPDDVCRILRSHGENDHLRISVRRSSADGAEFTGELVINDPKQGVALTSPESATLSATPTEEATATPEDTATPTETAIPRETATSTQTVNPEVTSTP